MGSPAKLHKYEDHDTTNPERRITYCFYCPGCECDHPFTVYPPGAAPAGKGWTFNGDMEKPTFSPSLLCNQHDPKSRCHLYLRDGKIQFLSDCHHKLAGQTVDMVDF